MPMTSYKANTVNLNPKHRHPDSAGSGLGDLRRTGTFVRPYEPEGEFPSIAPEMGKAHSGRMHGYVGFRASVDDAGAYNSKRRKNKASMLTDAQID